MWEGEKERENECGRESVGERVSECGREIECGRA